MVKVHSSFSKTSKLCSAALILKLNFWVHRVLKTVIYEQFIPAKLVLVVAHASEAQQGQNIYQRGLNGSGSTDLFCSRRRL